MKKLNFACGNWIIEGYDNCDIQRSPNVIYCNANKFPYPFEDNTYTEILCKASFNCFNNLRKVLNEFHRISKKGARIIISEIPHYNNKGAFNDLDTKHYLSEKSFESYLKGDCRIVKERKFDLVDIEITTTKLGRFIPEIIRKRLALFINGLYSQINVELEVVK